jgi:2-haloalkanoic acid dehalogenase type II
VAKERPFEILTFDCYGTLIDWESGIAGAFLAAAAGEGILLDRRRILEAYAEAEPTVQAASYRPYREVLALAARATATVLGWSLPAGKAGFLAASLPDWIPFPDTNPALERLARAGYRLGILSNVDDDLLAATCRHFKTPPELTVTAQQVRSYKPGHAHFLAARKRIGPAPWLHAAESYFHDIRPTLELGIPSAWINRGRRPLPPGSRPPERELRSLRDLADLLAPAGEGRGAP